jgi:hypothetical protein
VLLFMFVGSACQEDEEATISTRVRVIATEEGASVTRATDALVPFGRRAIVLIEAALHTAPEVGRKNLVTALRRIGDEAAAPLLGHLAAYDPSAEVRQEALWTLRSWLGPGAPSRARTARAALRLLDELGGREEGG